MSLLTRYLGREIYFSIALIFAALIALFAFLDLVRELNQMEGQYSFNLVLLVVALTIPGHIHELFPVAVLVGTILALVQMAASSELTIYRASGASMRQMLGALFRIALPLVVLSFLFGEFVAPPSERLAQQIRLKGLNTQFVFVEFRSGMWAKDEGSFVNVKKVLPDTSLSEVDIYRFDGGSRLQAITHANRATFIEQGLWKLEDVRETRFEKQGIRMNAAAVQDWVSSLNPGILSVLLIVPEQMSVYDLYQYASHLKENRQQSARYEIAMWGKLMYPVSLLVMMVLALPFASYRRRSGGASAMVFMGIVLGLVFHFAGKLFGSLGALNEWPAFLSASAMTIVFFGAGLAMLWWTERR